MTTVDETHEAEAHLRRRYADDERETDSPVVVFSQFAAEVFTDGLADIDLGDALAALRLVPHVRDIINNDERLTIAAARKLGMTWKQIAVALNLDSPQAAAQRFMRLGGQDGSGALDQPLAVTSRDDIGRPEDIGRACCEGRCGHPEHTISSTHGCLCLHGWPGSRPR